MENFFNFEALGKDFAKLIAQIRAGNSCSIFGVQNSMRPAICSALNKKIVFVTSDNILANAKKTEFELLGFKTLLFPIVPDSFIIKRAGSNEYNLERSLTLFNIFKKNFDAVIVPINSFFSFLPSAKEFKNHILKLKTNQEITIEKLERLLFEAGYRKEELISAEGQFSRRGEIVDVFPIGEKNPFRIDFFDLIIESIKVFDVTTQKGTKPVEEISICPATNLFLDIDEIDDIKHKISRLKKPAAEAGSEQLMFNDFVDDILTRLELGDRSYNLDVLAPYISDFRDNFFDYLQGQDCVFVIDECKQVYDSMVAFEKETNERIKNLKQAGVLFSGEVHPMFSAKEILDGFESKTCMAFLKITNSNKFFTSKAVFNFRTLPCIKWTHNQKEFPIDVKKYLISGYKVYIFAGDENGVQAVKNILSSHDLNFSLKTRANIFLEESSIVQASLSSGFILPEEKIAVIGTYDLFPKKRADNKLKANKASIFSMPKIGDYIVHQFHGIGVCEGVTRLSGNFGTKDYLVVRYRDGDMLYVPTTQMDMIEKFAGSDVPKRLNKIGGQEFSAVKAKVKDSVKKLAFNLLELYAKRDKIKGFAFSEDNDLQREFENAFTFTETEDQLLSIDEIKSDMEKPKVMDRLVCGDVGFGKTEVALRAIFKAVMDGKQAAFIAPTTILSEQHYNTARARMLDFGVNIEVLNRFKNKSQIDKILAGLASGDVDLVCGTHRILSDDVVFKNLGLIVLDEEQKFGVEDKEKLKNKYPFVDVLTLSATPIPRTLNMSLSGIRDISIISTPPSERLAIQTYIAEFSESLVRDAIIRELNRDGQVFILFNNVEKIYSFAEKVRRIVPDSKILVAHGQMGAKEMEKVIYDFYHRQGDILICTTIIENGIDIENANTLIVYDADRLGLSQLYQIRGRVGRGARQAYAYFTYEKDKTLSNEAYKRLDALSEFCDFGSGFKLAMRDLEIRGGGNIFGAEQSGHLQKVGYDMFTKLLAEAVKELKGEKIESTNDCLIKIAIDAFIPDDYIATSDERMVAYKRISAISSVEESQKIRKELADNYGKIPREVESLIDVAFVRKLAQKLGASEIFSFGNELDIVFDKKEKITESELIAEAVFKFRLNCSIDVSDKPVIKFEKEKTCRENFEVMKQFLILTLNLSEKLRKNVK